MKNTIMPQKDIDKAKEIIAKVNEYIENHEAVVPTFEEIGDTVQRIHSLVYMDVMKDLIRSAKLLEDILECPREKFIEISTMKGEMTLEEVEKQLMVNMLIESIERHG